MELKVLGTGCPKCKKLYEEAEKIVAACGRPIQLSKVESIPEIMAHGVLMTPAVVIDGKVKCAGRVPSQGELLTWIDEAAARS